MEAFVTIVLIGLAAIVVYRVILYILKERYFGSEE
ncbi:putative membrane protein, partial [Mycobacterium avium MAV_120809_2495]